MGITLQHAVVHSLVKEQNKALDDELQIIKDLELDITDSMVIRLVEESLAAYGKKENLAEYGKFKKENERGDFADACCLYVSPEIKNDQEQIDFLGLTEIFMKRLITAAQDRIQSSGGFIICAEYTRLSKEFLLFIMVKDQKGLMFDSELKPINVENIDLRKLHQGLRINKDELVEYLIDTNTITTQDGTDLVDEAIFLSFIGKTDGASLYFADAAGYEKGIGAKKVTDNVYKFIENKFKENEKLKGSESGAMYVLTDLFKTRKELKQPVNLNDIAVHLMTNFGDKFSDDLSRESFFDALPGEMNNETNKIPYTFNPSQKSITARDKIKYKSDELDITLSAGVITTIKKKGPVFWDAVKGEMVITIKPSPELAAEINSKLKI